MAPSAVRLIPRAPAVARTFAEAALDSLPDAVVCTDAGGRITYANIAGQRLLGCAPVAGASRLLSDFLQDDGAGAATLVRPDGRRVAIDTSSAPLRTERGQRPGAVWTLRDVSRAREAAQQLSYRAHHDGLTGLPNRALLDERLTAAITAGRENETPVAVCFLDVDGLKSVNDVFGHSVGDQVLTTTAARLIAVAGPHDAVSRYGGDEFVVVLTGLGSYDQARARAAALAQAVAAPHTVGAHAVQVAASLGLALFPAHGDTAAVLVARADAAMYAAKRDGGGHREADADVMRLTGARHAAAPRTFVAQRRRLPAGPGAAARGRAV